MELSLQLQQKQILSQKQQQSVAILQMNALALSEYAKELTEENPLLEWSEENQPQEAEKERLLAKLEWLEEDDEQNRGFARMERESREREREDSRFGKKEGESLREYLHFQINILHIPEDHKKALRFLAESTAESGWLEADAVAALTEAFRLKEQTAQRILAQFQTLDPSGVGARDLRECLLLQLRRANASETACAIVADYLEELAKNRLSFLAKRLKCSQADIMAALAEIRRCNPKPGSGFVGEGTVEYILPDIFVERQGDVLTVTTNSTATPRLRLNGAYLRMLREGADAEAETYIMQRLKQAEWVMQCITRRESTLQMVAECIVEQQRAFFCSPQGELAPLRMADVAERVGLHESTVSRAVREKYLQCERGVFPLHAFFSKAIAAETAAGGTVSAAAVQQRLRRLIEAENSQKPLSDRELAERLAAEGFSISRRTVAKYREAMGIAGASGRKRYENEAD